jgi:hypothetical protein
LAVVEERLPPDAAHVTEVSAELPTVAVMDADVGVLAVCPEPGALEPVGINVIEVGVCETVIAGTVTLKFCEPTPTAFEHCVSWSSMISTLILEVPGHRAVRVATETGTELSA